MTRLTEKRDNFYYDINECVISDCSNKLGQLEDIEEELGIDLITLFETLKHGITEKDGNTVVYYTADRLSIEYKNKCFRKKWQKFYFKDYGATWVVGDQLWKKVLWRRS